jgi:hypothetical protein
MNRLLAFVWLLALCQENACLGATQVRSVADLDGLKAQAFRSKRLVLLFITSSDGGCWQCKKLGKDFLGDREFNEWVERSTVFGEVDIATKSRAARETMLSIVYAAHAGPVPSLILLHPDGRRLAQAPNENWPVGQSLASFRSIFAREIEGATGVALTNATAATWGNGPIKPAETHWDPPGAKPVHYSGLKLKNIAQSGRQRFALLNDQTLTAGETAKVLSNGTRINVKLLAIREDSVEVLVEGEPQPRILQLKGN